MARPQAENGHIDIANEIAEALCRANLSPYENRILWALWRKTYGWHKKEDIISCTQFQDLTGLRRRHISRTLKRLIDRHIITSEGTTRRNIKVVIYAFQKDYEKWKVSPIEVILPKQVGGVSPKQVGGVSPKQVDTKETIKETIQKKQSTAHNQKIQDIFQEMRAYLGYPNKTKKDPIPSYGKEGMFIKRMFARGFTREEVLNLWKKKVSQRGGEFVSMTWVNEDIGKGQQTAAGPDKYKNQKYSHLIHGADDPDKYIRGKYGHLVKR